MRGSSVDFIVLFLMMCLRLVLLLGLLSYEGSSVDFLVFFFLVRALRLLFFFFVLFLMRSLT